jgi:hypothetical protein
MRPMGCGLAAAVVAKKRTAAAVIAETVVICEVAWILQAHRASWLLLIIISDGMRAQDIRRLLLLLLLLLLRNARRSSKARPTTLLPRHPACSLLQGSLQNWRQVVLQKKHPSFPNMPKKIQEIHLHYSLLQPLLQHLLC